MESEAVFRALAIGMSTGMRRARTDAQTDRENRTGQTRKHADGQNRHTYATRER